VRFPKNKTNRFSLVIGIILLSSFAISQTKNLNAPELAVKVAAGAKDNSKKIDSAAPASPAKKQQELSTAEKMDLEIQNTDVLDVKPSGSITQAGGNSSTTGKDNDLPKPILNPARPVKIVYKVTSEKTSLLIILRDSASGRMAKLDLQTYNEKTKSIEGYYRISFAADKDVIVPEVYVFPASLIKAGADQFAKIDQLIKDEILVRKPFFLKLDTENNQLITVFDSKEQAVAAFKDFRSVPVSPLVNPQNREMPGRDIVNKAALEAARLAALEAEKQRIEALQKIAEANRIKALEEEKLKREEALKEQQRLDEAERNRRKKVASDTVAEALAAYKAQNFAVAEEKFKNAIALDPSNEQYYFQYGVTQFKLGKYNQSISSLRQAQKGDYNPLEKNYFLALNYMKLKEMNFAFNEFMVVKKGNDKVLSPAAGFFAAVIDFNREKYDDAKANFEYVLDNSDDKNLDSQSEAYLEQILSIKQFQEEEKKKFILSFNAGLNYDSNVLALAPENYSSLSDSGISGIRTIYSGTLEYRPIYKAKHEFSATLTYADMFSTDTKLKGVKLFQNADPLVLGFGLPYKYKGMVFGKGYQFGFTPGYELTNMNSDGAGTRENVLKSNYFKFEQTFVMSEDYFAAYNLEYRMDNPAAVTSADDDLTNTKYTFNTSHTIFRDKKKTEAYVGDFSYVMTNAKGNNIFNTKMECGGTYLKPFYWDSSLSGRLSLGSTNYSKHTVGRKDTALGLALNLSKPLSVTQALVFSLGWNNMNSTLSTFSNTKTTFLAMWSWRPSLY
jgi:tetratricopeptide (TPR) repeat protein